MQDLGTAAGRRVSRKGRGDIPLNQRTNSGELGSERARHAVDLIWSESLAWSLRGKQDRAAANLFTQPCERRRKVCGYRRLTICGNAELAWKECRTKFGEYARDLAP
jgi:hypothetical protein